MNLEQYIKELNNISYPDKSKEESKRTELMSLFTEMLTYVRSEGKSEAASSGTDTTTAK